MANDSWHLKRPFHYLPVRAYGLYKAQRITLHFTASDE